MSLFAAANRERLAAGVLVALSVVFVGVAVLQRVHRGDADVLLPLALLAADLTIAGALLSGWYPVRPVAQGLAIFGALAHVLLLMGGRPELLIRISAGLLAVAHVYSLVLLFQLGAGYDDEEDDEAEPAVDRSPVARPAPVVPDAGTESPPEGEPAAAVGPVAEAEPTAPEVPLPATEQEPVVGQEPTVPEAVTEGEPATEREPVVAQSSPVPDLAAQPEPVVDEEASEPGRVPSDTDADVAGAEADPRDEPEAVVGPGDGAEQAVASTDPEAEPSIPQRDKAEQDGTAHDDVEQHRPETDSEQHKSVPVTTVGAEPVPTSEERAR